MWVDSSDLNSAEKAILLMFGHGTSPDTLSSQDIRSIVDILKPSGQIAKIGLLGGVREGEREMIQLTVGQYSLLEIMQNHDRVRIAGCAGSGKTMLAIEKARRLALQGMRVLVTCYNKGLSAWIREQLEIDTRPEFERVHIYHYHDLAMTMCSRAGMPQTVPPGDSSEFWETTLPEALMEAIPLLHDWRYDAIIVDEGQDFDAGWWVTLEELLRDPKRSIFYIFHDNNQRLYRRARDMPVTEAPYVLNSNCRTTKTIHNAVMDYFHDVPKPGAGGSDGRKVDFVPRESDDCQAVRKVVADLCDGEGMSTEQLVVLTPRSKGRSGLKDGMKIGNRSLVWTWKHDPNDVLVSTIHSFKGLERDVVILAETHDLTGDPKRCDMLCYVALSRAKHHVVVIGPLPSRLPAWVEA